MICICRSISPRSTFSFVRLKYIYSHVYVVSCRLWHCKEEIRYIANTNQTLNLKSGYSVSQLWIMNKIAFVLVAIIWFVLVAILFVYITILKWKSTEKWGLRISKKTAFNSVIERKIKTKPVGWVQTPVLYKHQCRHFCTGAEFFCTGWHFTIFYLRHHYWVDQEYFWFLRNGSLFFGNPIPPSWAPLGKQAFDQENKKENTLSFKKKTRSRKKRKKTRSQPRK